METATITEVKNGLSAIIDRVRAGESILVTDRGIPVAVIEPVGSRVDVEDRLRRLERAGLIRAGNGRSAVETLRALPAPPVVGPGPDTVEILLEERRTGR